MEVIMKNSSGLLFCLNCGKPLNKRQTKYCSNNCQGEYEYNEFIKKWKLGLENGMRGSYQLSNYIIRYIKEKYNNKCCKCGWDKINPTTGNSPLEVHHKDGDYTNNDEDNLELLCPNCHSLTDTYKNTLNHKGRQGRDKYYKNKSA
jgi:Zn finger protein HypA/HybF involved in hydrogenase expression